MPGGRPRIELDIKQFENLCSLQCSQEEICGFFDICEDTLNAWCKRTYGKSFSEVFAIKRGTGKISLRRSQFRLAEKSAAMAIFLGKQFLGQRDVVEHRTQQEDDNKLLEAITESALEVWDNVQAIQHEADADNELVDASDSE